MSCLEKIAGEKFSRVKRDWQGSTVAILGGGPSLSAGQVSLVKARKEEDPKHFRVIAINDSYLLAPFADVCYFADSQWWEWQIEGRAKSFLGLNAGNVRIQFAAFAGQKCSIEHSGSRIKDEHVHVLRQRNTFPGVDGPAFSDDPRYLTTARNSGYQALNLALLSGAFKIILLGYDARPDPEGRAHWFGEHPTSIPQLPAFYEQMRRMFSLAEKALEETGVEIVNCSPCTWLNAFKKDLLERALA